LAGSNLPDEDVSDRRKDAGEAKIFHPQNPLATAVRLTRMGRWSAAYVPRGDVHDRIERTSDEVALASVAFCTVALDALVVMTALSTMGRGLGATMETLEWTVNAYI
jgi:hypothetical protein